MALLTVMNWTVLENHPIYLIEKDKHHKPENIFNNDPNKMASSGQEEHRFAIEEEEK